MHLASSRRPVVAWHSLVPSAKPTRPRRSVSACPTQARAPSTRLRGGRRPRAGWPGYEWFDVNVGVVGGDARPAGRRHPRLRARGARGASTTCAGSAPARWSAVVNTHEHFDHTFGNGVFPEAYGGLPVIAHEAAAERTVAAGERHQGAARRRARRPAPRRGRRRPGRAADHTFSSARVVDLGDRSVELVHPGRGHTAGDLVVRVAGRRRAARRRPGRGVGGPARCPGFGDDCYPMEWPATLDLVLGLLDPGHAWSCPGHGAPVDRDFVEEQRSAIGVVAETIRDLAAPRRAGRRRAGRGRVALPAPRSSRHAVRRGYEHLPRSSPPAPRSSDRLLRVGPGWSGPPVRSSRKSGFDAEPRGPRRCDSLGMAAA